MAYIKQTWVDDETPITADKMNHIEDGIGEVEASLTQQISLIQGGTPTPVSSASAMTDTSVIYLYTGNEEGYESGHWYYYNGSEWTDGGQYGADGGINNNARNLLKYILEKVVYTETGMGTYINALYQALAQAGGGGGGDHGGATMYTVTNNLTDVTNSNDTLIVYEGDSYTATLTVPEDYYIDSVTITMGGVDITSTAYDNGTINIDSVTGAIVITAEAVSSLMYRLPQETTFDGTFSINTGVYLFAEDFDWTIAFHGTFSRTDNWAQTIFGLKENNAINSSFRNIPWIYFLGTNGIFDGSSGSSTTVEVKGVLTHAKSSDQLVMNGWVKNDNASPVTTSKTTTGTQTYANMIGYDGRYPLIIGAAVENGTSLANNAVMHDFLVKKGVFTAEEIASYLA